MPYILGVPPPTGTISTGGSGESGIRWTVPIAVPEDADVVLTPQPAVREAASSAIGTTGKPKVVVEHLYIVNGNSYTKTSGATECTEKVLTAAALAAAAGQFSPYFIEGKFDAIGGIALAGTRHYQVAGAGAKVSAFLDAAFGITGKTLTRYAIGEITIDFCVNASGQPVKIAVAGASPADPLTASETFASCNQSLTINPTSTTPSSYAPASSRVRRIVVEPGPAAFFTAAHRSA